MRIYTRIYTGILGQFGDILISTAAVRFLKQLDPSAAITFAISRSYSGVGDLLHGLPFVDYVFRTQLYFELLTPYEIPGWEAGLRVDLRGEDEVAEQHRHDLVFETRPLSALAGTSGRETDLLDCRQRFITPP